MLNITGFLLRVAGSIGLVVSIIYLYFTKYVASSFGGDWTEKRSGIAILLISILCIMSGIVINWKCGRTDDEPNKSL